MADRYAKIKAQGKTKPETFSQARRWQVVNNKYLSYGLCPRCASQAAWGHQNGFSTLHEPCIDCKPLVALLPISTGINSPWRKF